MTGGALFNLALIENESLTDSALLISPAAILNVAWWDISADLVKDYG